MINQNTTSSLEWNHYWINRWNKGEIGWHQTEPEPGMVSFFSGSPTLRVFVPLCGKSKDLLWFLQQGHEVVGIELSEMACQAFFEENQIPFQRCVENQTVVFRGPRISIFNQNIFTLTSAQLGKIDAVYDRAAFIALPPETRKLYAQWMIKFIQESFCSDQSKQLRFCQLVIERSPPDQNGPPFSIFESELKELYGQTFQIELISREKISEDNQIRTDECVYRIKL